MKRITLAGLPHHVIQRGLNGRKTFYCDEDYTTYIETLSECTNRHGVKILCYCLMPDHVHLIAIPKTYHSLTNCLRATHGRYTKYIHHRMGTHGQFWKGRYASHLLDENYLIDCARYIEINPVKRNYVAQPDEWQWSSAKAHITNSSDLLVDEKPLLQKGKSTWQDFLQEIRPDGEADMFYSHERNGQPLGSDSFLTTIKRRLQLEKN